MTNKGSMEGLVKFQGVPGRSGPPRNLNALKHGAYSQALAVPKGREWVAEIVDRHYQNILAELGGTENITERKLGIIWAAMIFLKRALLMEADLIRRGDTKRDGNLRDPVRKQPSYLRGYVESLKLLGLERSLPDPDDIDAVLRREALAGRNGVEP